MDGGLTLIFWKPTTRVKTFLFWEAEMIQVNLLFEIRGYMTIKPLILFKYKWWGTGKLIVFEIRGFFKEIRKIHVKNCWQSWDSNPQTFRWSNLRSINWSTEATYETDVKSLYLKKMKGLMVI